MIIGFSKHGRGSGDQAVAYLTDGAVEILPYLTGKTRRGLERNPPPVVVRGDPRLTAKLIRLVPFIRKYTSGVLSFSEKQISPEAETQIMDRFEAAAFAGLAKDRYAILWVRHSHVGRHELHFLSPAVALGTGKALNINPPRKSTRETFDTLRRLLNDEFHLSDPDDPVRARSIRVPSYLANGKPTRADLRSRVTAFLDTKVRAGVIKDRAGVLRVLKNAGYTVARTGDEYVTIVDTDGRRCRLTGAVFSRDIHAAPEKVTPGRLLPTERAALEAKLARLVAARAAFNARRYHTTVIIAQPLPHLSPHPQPERTHDGIGTPTHCRIGAFDERVGRAQRSLNAAVERTRAAGIVLCDRALALGRSRERLDRATRTFGESLGRFEERSLTAALCRKYGARSVAHEHDQTLELERDRYATPV